MKALKKPIPGPLILILLLAVMFARIASADVAAPSPEIDRVAAILEPLLSSLSPTPKQERESPSSVQFSYRTRSYRVHGASMTGEYEKEAREETGPDSDGFILQVDLQEKGRINQADTPQILRRPYWETYVQTTPVVRSDKQLYWGLSYGSRTDKKLLARIRGAIGKVAEGLPANQSTL